MKQEHTVEISLMKLQRAELALMSIGAKMIKAGDYLKEHKPHLYGLMEADAEGLADALEIIRWLANDIDTGRVS